MLTTVIEAFLKAIDQATFQKMMNHLLFLEGYKFVGSPGSVIGKNKTSKGSPDSFFELEDSYAFCELTTQERLTKSNSFYNKLKKDVDHCFDIKATGIEKSKVIKVILAFTEELKPKEHIELKKRVKDHNPKAELVIYSIQEIPFRLLYYPGLADRYIPGVKTTKGTLYTLPDFLSTTEKGLQPSLTNPFLGREDELKQAKDYLKVNDILIISGTQGVGKSKLGVQLAEVLEDEEGFEPRVIASSPVPLWEDLNNFILPHKKYVILFDDANKSLPNLDYLLQYILSREGGTTKIIITIRDYVRQDLNRYLLNFPYNEISVKNLSDEQVIEIIKKSLPQKTSLDPLIFERIVSLSKGNSRLALMALSSILKNNDISVLDNVFSLYDQYFQKVKNDLTFINNAESLTALGILSFFGVLDRNNDEHKAILENNFNVNWTQLWESYLELEKFELVDVFSNEVAKISDQVLATYVFYKTFIDENYSSIDYSLWVETFIDKLPKKISRSLIDVVNTFGFIELKDRVISLIIGVQRKLEPDNNKLFNFFEIFWPYREVDTLLFIQNWINGLQKEKIKLGDIQYSFKANDFVWAPEYLKLLINFWRHSTPFIKESLDLGLKLMFRQPSRIPETLKHLSEHVSFHRFDYRYGYIRQHAFLNALDNRTLTKRERSISDKLFLTSSPSLLGWNFHQTESRGEQMIIYNFHLVKTQPLMELRKKVLERLINLFPRNQNEVLEAFSIYYRTAQDFDSSIYADEQPILAEFIKNNLSAKRYSHCRLVSDYTEALKENKIEPIDNWESFINSDSMQIAKIFNYSLHEDSLDYDDLEVKKREEIKSFIKGKGINFIKSTLKKVESVYSDSSHHSDTYWLQTCLSYLFQSLAETNTKLFLKSLNLLIHGRYDIDLSYGNIIFYPIKKKLINIREFYDHINRDEYKQKQFWKQMFFEAIEEDEINEFFLLEFVNHNLALNKDLYIYNLDSYIKFNKQFNMSKALLPDALEHSNIITYLTEILISKATTTGVSFDRQICEKCVHYFHGKMELLKQAYFFLKRKDSHYDYNGKEMAAISTVEPSFIIEYLKEITKDIDYIEFKLDKLNLYFIWDLPNYAKILDNALEIIIKKAPIFSSFEHQANIFFKRITNQSKQQDKALRYISRFIQKNSNSKQHIQIVMNVVVYRFPHQILRFLKEFLLLNKSLDFVTDMWLEKSGMYSGSRVPEIEAHINFTKKIIDMVKTLPSPLDYADHINYWEQQIEWAKKDKQQELKRDFVGWLD